MNPLNLLHGLTFANGTTWDQPSGPTDFVVPAVGIVGYISNEGEILDYAMDNIKPTCNAVDGSPELVYKFTLEQSMGFEVMVTGAFPLDDTKTIYEGYTGAVDTLVAIHKAPEDDCSILETPTGADVYCSDDSVPPGALGSRVVGLLLKGTYTLVISSYSPNSFGPHRAFVKFTGNDIRPTSCNGAFCGGDSAGGFCGLWHYFTNVECLIEGETCSRGRCSNCDPSYTSSLDYRSNCAGDQCGFDQCGFSCGNYNGGCLNKRECNLLTRKCKPTTPCDSLVPDCRDNGEGWKSERYCGNDCQLYRIDDKLPDIMAPTESEVKTRLFFQEKDFTPEHCGVREGSVQVPEGITEGETFVGKMMFFDTNTHNIGESFNPPSREKRPDLFTWGECHGHDHFEQFAKFSLKTLQGEAASNERLVKLAYCMEDSQSYLSGPFIPCVATGICEDQSISAGWSDNYYSDLDGQWIDVSALSDGWYVYEVDINYARVFHERSFDNNKMRMLVYIDPQYICSSKANYCDVIIKSDACNSIPTPLPMGVVSPPECEPGNPIECLNGSDIETCI